jgi:ATP-dependent Lhr-like helicase
MNDVTRHRSLESFSPAVREWFSTNFAEPTAPQVQGWPVVAAGSNALICAPTGSGKTLAAFLAAVDRLTTTAPPEGRARTRVVYVSPLRALAFDVEKNLRAPVVGIGHAATRLGVPFVEPRIAMRTGDTSARDRTAMVRNPPDLLITTPESLYLMLTSSARETLAAVETVIIDEIHVMAAGKRGAHLMLSIERLEELVGRPVQRIGLSATQRPLEEVARFLGGQRDGEPRPVTIVDTGVRKPMQVTVVVPVEDMADLGSVTTELTSGPATAALTPRRTSIWPAIAPRILGDIMEHRTTIVFCNARRQAERLAAQLNELAVDAGLSGPDGEDFVRAHHGSLAREQRVLIEDALKSGRLRAIVATSSLELGIDMGTVDLVVQVESPGAVSRGLQRVGRAGHSVGEPSVGRLYPKHRHDLLESAVVASRMLEGRIESTRYLRNPLDVVAQQIVAHVAVSGEVSVEDLGALLRRAACCAEMTDDVLHAVLDLLSGRYPSDEFSGLRPRLVWDRVAGIVRARDGAQRLAVVNGGTIADRGMFGVFLPEGTRVGELDEEMVYETRPGETFLLGASTWRIEDITFDKVIVTPAPGVPGKMPFWHGDRPGRPVELGRALGGFVRSLRGGDGPAAASRLASACGLDELAVRNLLAYLEEQAAATGVVPDDTTIVVERFRDEIGDWRVCIHSPFGSPVHAPWAMAIEHAWTQRHGTRLETMWSDDGIVLRLPEAVDGLEASEIVLDPDLVHDTVVESLPGTALFASRFREAAARALLLPRRRPHQRTPLWQQRQRAADLLAVASRHPTFPILLETTRECMQDVFDVPALREILAGLRSRTLRLVEVDTPRASPFAQSLLFNWIAAYMYEGDAPLAERRAAALALDRDLLGSLLGADELRELLGADVIDELHDELQCLADGRRARTADELHDVLRRVGELDAYEAAARSDGDPGPWLDELVRQRRALPVRIAGRDMWIAAQDAGRYRDALGCSLVPGLPGVFTDPVADPFGELLARHARTRAPFTAASVAVRWGTPPERVESALAALEARGAVVRGEFSGSSSRQWCDAEVLRVLRRRSLARLRREVEPVDQRSLARFVTSWQGLDAPGRGADALVSAIGILQGASLVASTFETDVLAPRVAGYRGTDLDALCTSGELLWTGAGALGANDGRIRLYFADQYAVLAPVLERPAPAEGELCGKVRDFLATHGAVFFSQLRSCAPGSTDAEVLEALWDLVWAGEATNDSLVAMRARLSGSARAVRAERAGRMPAGGSRVRPGRLSRIGPPAGAGRWSLLAAQDSATPTESLHAAARQLLERHGVVTREAALSEGILGGFASVYTVLRAMEDRGHVRRGYFVAGLGAAQFALPGAVDRLRQSRSVGDADGDDESRSPLVLAATDPAQPHGATLPWPESAGRPSRSAGALVVLHEGRALAWFDHRGGNLVVFTDGDHSDVDDRVWAEALVTIVKDGRRRSIEVRRIDGAEPTVGDPRVAALEACGFVRSYKGWVLRA